MGDRAAGRAGFVANMEDVLEVYQRRMIRRVTGVLDETSSK